MSLQDHPNHEEINKKDKQRSHPPHPADTDRRLPLRDNKHRHQAKGDAVGVERYRSLDGSAQEALNDVVVADGQNEKGGEPNEERSQCENHKVQVEVQARSVNGQSDGQKDAGEDGVGETVLGMPLAAAAAGHQQRDLVVEHVSVGLGTNDTHPCRHREEGELERREAVSASLDGGAHVDGQRRRLHDGESKSHKDVHTDKDGNWGHGDLERDNRTAFLDECSS